MNAVPDKSYFAGLAMQALIQREDLRLVFQPDGPPQLNSFCIRDTHKSAESVLAHLAWRIADAMVEASK